jgi:hypothetical protein
MDIAQVDQRARVRELSVHKEVSYFDGVVESSLPHNTFNFFEVTHSSAGLNVLEVDIGVVSMWQDIAQENQKALSVTVLLENLDRLLSVDFAGVLDGNLSDEGTILSV